MIDPQQRRFATWSNTQVIDEWERRHEARWRAYVRVSRLEVGDDWVEDVVAEALAEAALLDICNEIERRGLPR